MKDDGRYIDTSIATLEGEASGQITHSGRNAPETAPVSWHADAREPTYYDRPMLKQPVWIWSIPAYFFVGGISGAAMTMGMAVQLFGSHGMRSFDERCRWVGAIGGGIGSGLLILDLGRKMRFLFMLRVFRPTSPMSVGSWVLAMATPLSAGSALLTMAKGWRRRVGHLMGMASGLLGMPLATYTAVLLANTAVPLWFSARKTLPLLFGASSMAALGSVLEMMPLNERECGMARTFGTAGRFAELVAAKAVEREISEVPDVATPLHSGLPGTLWTAAAVCTTSSLVISLFPRSTRLSRTLGAVLGLLGGACIRFSVFYAGKASARDPRATIRQQRSLPAQLANVPDHSTNALVPQD